VGGCERHCQLHVGTEVGNTATCPATSATVDQPMLMFYEQCCHYMLPSQLCAVLECCESWSDVEMYLPTVRVCQMVCQCASNVGGQIGWQPGNSDLGIVYPGLQCGRGAGGGGGG